MKAVDERHTGALSRSCGRVRDAQPQHVIRRAGPQSHGAAGRMRRLYGRTLGAVLACTLMVAGAALVSAVPAGAALPAGSSGQSMLLAVQHAELTGYDHWRDHVGWFGCSVAISGDTALVGMCADAIGWNLGQGSAYVFVRSGTSWRQQAKLIAGDGAAGDHFGQAVAISGDTALVGEPGDIIGANDTQGSAYVFVRSGVKWTQQAKLTAVDGAAGNRFGYSVALLGDTALVGSTSDNLDWSLENETMSPGAAYVFVRAAGGWSQQAKLVSGAHRGDDFGCSVALWGDTALVGARQAGAHNDAIAYQGAAYVFTRSGATWVRQAELAAGDGTDGDCFGSAVALSEDTALVGAPADNIGINGEQGSACVFVRSGATWTQQAKLTTSGGSAHDRFGESVAVSDDTALIGAPGALVSDGTYTHAGEALVFARSGTGWSRQAELTASPSKAVATVNDFGPSIALERDTVVVGAPEAMGLVGAAYVFWLGVDTTAPTTRAFPASVRKGAKVDLGYQVNDAIPGCSRAKVTLKFFKSGALKKAIKLPGRIVCNVRRTLRWRCTLPRGSYTLKVYATDLAGNVQSQVGRAKLKVR
jgi:hypothetical protein